MSEMWKDCPRCIGGNMKIEREYDGSDYYFCWLCVQCGEREYITEEEIVKEMENGIPPKPDTEGMSLRNKDQTLRVYYEENKAQIKVDITKLGKEKARKKWGIPSQTFLNLRRAWGLPIDEKYAKHKKSEKPTKNPWELARELNQALIVRILGPMYGVYYPDRKTGDLYVAIEGHPIRCCQCDEDIPYDKGLGPWLEHIRKHSRKKLARPMVIIGKDNEGKLQVFTEKKPEE